jgi:predicted kinase
MKQTVYLLCGLPGSGKTTYAKSLENKNTLRYSLDEEIIKKYGKDFKPSKYQEYEAIVKDEIDSQLIILLRKGFNVILDFGFWKRIERDRYKSAIQKMDAESKLLFFSCPINILENRLNVRNNSTSVDSQVVTIEMLHEFEKVFEPPVNEGENIIQ